MNIAISILEETLDKINDRIKNYKNKEHFYYVKDILISHRKQLEKAIKILKRAE